MVNFNILPYFGVGTVIEFPPRMVKSPFSVIGIATAAVLSFGGNLASAQSSADCLACHGEPSLSMEKKGRTVSLYVNGSAFAASAHGGLECASCHENLNAGELPHAARIVPVNCLACHSDEEFTRYASSIHGKKDAKGRRAATCVDCHSTHAIDAISSREGPARKEFAAHMCEKCHADVGEEYTKSDHGKALAAGVKGAPSCIDCHDEHEVVAPADSGATTSRSREAAMCLSCHLDNPDVRGRVGPSAKFISSYEQSVHGQAMAHGNEGAAICTDCHGSHSMKKGSDPTSGVAKAHIAGTCGQCHADIQEQFNASIHGKALAAGNLGSATCTDCHGEHSILPRSDPRSPVAPTNVSAQACSPCHASLKLTAKYGLAGDRFRSFEDSYHGLAGRAGSVEVANCASCHGVHDIKPSTDPASRINPDNLAATCGSCHPGANVNFTKGSVHVMATENEDTLLYYVSNLYIVLIVVTIGGMAFHNALDFIKKARRRLMMRRGLVPHPAVSHRLYLRMTLSERIQHGALVVSFFTLVFTGFALKYPEAWWVAPLRDLSPAMFALRGILHRIAGVVMVAAGMYHVYYLAATVRGRRLFFDLLPVRRDLTDAIGVMKYNLGVAGEKPLLDRFSYVEKAEYWALIWGTVVMAVTGVILWFDNTFLGMLTKLGWDVARTIHYYEAWLATLAVIVWHFYFVIFNPDIYPINLAFWKGTLTEEEMQEEHPLELEEIRRREREADDTARAEAG